MKLGQYKHFSRCKAFRVDILIFVGFARIQSDEKYRFSQHVTPATMRLKPSNEIVRLLHSHQSIELVAFFVYGTDFDREMNIFFVPKSIQLGTYAILLFICAAAILLSIVRRKFGLARGRLLDTFADCWIPFIGGGNLQMQHKWERWFFGILLFGAFFIVSVFAGDLLDCIIRVLNAKVSTLDQVAEINPPIFLDIGLYQHQEPVKEMLRCAKKVNSDLKSHLFYVHKTVVDLLGPKLDQMFNTKAALHMSRCRNTRKPLL